MYEKPDKNRPYLVDIRDPPVRVTTRTYVRVHKTPRHLIYRRLCKRSIAIQPSFHIYVQTIERQGRLAKPKFLDDIMVLR